MRVQSQEYWRKYSNLKYTALASFHTQQYSLEYNVCVHCYPCLLEILFRFYKYGHGLFQYEKIYSLYEYRAQLVHTFGDDQ